MSSRYSLVHILSTTFRIEPRNRASSGDRGQPLYPKKHRVLRPRIFSAMNSRVPARSHFPTTWWWCDWHDDVVDMMVRQLAVRIVRNSEVSQLNFLWPIINSKSMDLRDMETQTSCRNHSCKWGSAWWYSTLTRLGSPFSSFTTALRQSVDVVDMHTYARLKHLQLSISGFQYMGAPLNHQF